MKIKIYFKHYFVQFIYVYIMSNKSLQIFWFKVPFQLFYLNKTSNYNKSIKILEKQLNANFKLENIRASP